VKIGEILLNFQTTLLFKASSVIFGEKFVIFSAKNGD
jgi:hypothetical protein